VNQDFLDVSLIDNANAVIGITDEAMPWAYNARALMQNDMQVVKSASTQIFMEQSIYQGKPHYFRSKKSPLLGRLGKIIGVQCISIPISDLCLVPLTKQQTACLRHLALGLTHKQIGQELGLSQKTVEHYLDSVKLKLSCKTRAELIRQAMERGLIGL
jgi:DNA-binding NarL/FixJ family response regulator